MALDNLQDLLIEQLRDLYSAEKQLVQALPKMAKGATTPQLQSAFQDHLSVTENHVARLEQAFEELGVAARAKKCKGMEGLIEEGAEMLEEDAEPDVRDAGLIAAAQRVEHYEIAAYGTVRAMAVQLGFEQVAQLADDTLSEEKEADRKLTELAEDQINVKAENEEGSGETEVAGGLRDDEGDGASSDREAAPRTRGGKNKPARNAGRSRSR